ncbi:hypothetical protein JKY72_04025 [Candidatus Gracilibacteria bacterium]|nr:hypothetical protein [Candidatus Gracilibacteria bacterium]
MPDSTQVIYLTIVALILLWLMYTLYRVKVYRFYRPGCFACRASQGEWAKFKHMCRFRRIKVVDVDMSKQTDETRELAAKMGVVGVPHVVAVYNDGARIAYDGQRTADRYLNWVQQR